MTYTSKEKSTTQPPIEQLRDGRVSAAIWERRTEAGIFHSVTFERRYRDRSGAWKSSRSFDAVDLLTLAKLCHDLHRRVNQMESQAE